MPTRLELLSLYKSLLLHARKFPSVKRLAIVDDIRAEFRDNATLTDEAKVANCIELGLRGLSTLQKYTSLDKASPSWQVSLDEDPLGANASHQRRAEAFYASQTAKGKDLS